MTKQEAYRAGHYIFPVPPVVTFNWDENSWIKFIDYHGRWTVPIKYDTFQEG